MTKYFLCFPLLFILFYFLIKDSEVLSAPETSCNIDCKEHGNFTKNRIPVLSVLFLLRTEFPKTWFFLSCCFSLLLCLWRTLLEVQAFISASDGTQSWMMKGGGRVPTEQLISDLCRCWKSSLKWQWSRKCGVQENLPLWGPAWWLLTLSFTDLWLLKRVCFVWWFLFFFSSIQDKNSSYITFSFFDLLSLLKVVLLTLIGYETCLAFCLGPKNPEILSLVSFSLFHEFSLAKTPHWF